MLILDELVVVLLDSEEDDDSVVDVVDLVLVFEVELVVVDNDEDVECVERIDCVVDAVVLWRVESLDTEVILVFVVVSINVEFDEGVIVAFAAVFVVVFLPAAPSVDKFLKLADVTPAAIKTATIPINNTVADLFKFCLKIEIISAREIELAKKLSRILTQLA